MNRALDTAAEITDEFSFLDDWEDRYQHLIDLGRKLPPLDAQYKSEEFRLRGCQSVVHFAAEQKDDEIVFHAGSDAAIVQGLIALLIRVYSGRTAEEIRETEAHFLTDIGLDSHLSATRKTGLASMLTAIKAAAQ
ncbi:MAG: SufE family protein [Bacteroidetes bacterium]|jgi:cysteine desulfuration protein SufE|nr:SufE family protein [Bacteroidota bacterium]